MLTFECRHPDTRKSSAAIGRASAFPSSEDVDVDVGRLLERRFELALRRSASWNHPAGVRTTHPRRVEDPQRTKGKVHCLIDGGRPLFRGAPRVSRW